MKLLITGGMGFIGSNFIRYIMNMRECTDIINVDAFKYGSNAASLRDVEDDDRYSFVQGDISDHDLMSRLVKKVDTIVNFAAETHVDRSVSNPGIFFQTNVVGVFTLLESLRKNNPDAKFIQISTDEVYGDTMEGSFKESDALRPSSPYSASKGSSDVFVLAYARTYGIHSMVTRCTNNYGPYQFPEKLIPKTIIRALKGLQVPIYGTGKNVRDWIHVMDHCKAIDLVINNGERGEIYNISSGDEKTNLDVVSEILGVLGKYFSQIDFVEDRPGHDVRYSLDSTKLQKDLGWRPEKEFDKGIKETVNWYIKNESWWKNLADEKLLDPTPWRRDW